MMNVEYLRRQGTFDIYMIDGRYKVYLHNWANIQNLVIDTRTDENISETNKGKLCICAAYAAKHSRWYDE